MPPAARSCRTFTLPMRWRQWLTSSLSLSVRVVVCPPTSTDVVLSAVMLHRLSYPATTPPTVVRSPRATSRRTRASWFRWTGSRALNVGDTTRPSAPPTSRRFVNVWSRPSHRNAYDPTSDSRPRRTWTSVLARPSSPPPYPPVSEAAPLTPPPGCSLRTMLMKPALPSASNSAGGAVINSTDSTDSALIPERNWTSPSAGT